MGVITGTEYYISKGIGKAITDYDMLRDSDKIVVAVSGGKDSLTLLKVLKDRQRFVPVKYKLFAVHIDLGYPKSIAGPLEKYFKKLGVDYHIEKVDTLKQMKRKDIDCFWCSWNRRKALFETADRLGCVKVALGHHMDDIIQTMLLNLFFHGEISAMSPKQELFGGKIMLIRPLAYVEENLIKKFAKSTGFPDFNCKCPNSLTSNRAHMGEIIRDLKRSNPDVKKNIFRSLKKIKSEYLP